MARLVSWSGIAPALRGGALLYGLAAWAALGLAIGCSDSGTPCKKRGATQACSCSDGAKGSQQCLPERVWGECNCDATSPMDAGGGGRAPGSGGTGGKGGSSGAGGAGSGSGGAGGVSPGTMGNHDGGNVPDAMASGGHDGGGSGGAPDGGGMGGSGGTVAPAGSAYGKCMDDSDCEVADSTCTLVVGVPPLTEDSSACGPPCQQDGDCPVPAGSYDATVTCVEQHCELDCTPEVLGPERSCPAGLTCTASLAATSSCLVP